MSDVPSLAIPYEKQVDLQNGRMCGAAALSMVYRSYAKSVAQAEVWPHIAKHNRFGSLTAATHLITKDALKRGFAALAIQTANPLMVLRRCQDHGIRVILNHRLQEEVATGHYTVLVDIDDDSVLLHDPYYGPSRHVAHANLLDLWRPRYLNAEIAGNVLIGIAPEGEALPACSLCGAAIPPHVSCPRCGEAVPLQPAALLGCLGAECPGRMWRHIYCPFCDHALALGRGDAQEHPAPGSEEDADRLNELAAAIDKFTNLILSFPQLAGHPEVRHYVDLLQESKGQQKMAQSEVLYHRKVHEAQTAQLVRKSRAQEAAFLKKQEEMAKPAPPLDGNALGQSLAKDLGLLGLTPTPVKAAPPKPNGAAKPAANGKTQATTKVNIGDPEILEYLKRKGLWN
jgi:hypothetical protein